ncbi:MAG: trigger factor [Planctomycetes bacterium]|nr:trigger factor [Planctomycetota bacterium]
MAKKHQENTPIQVESTELGPCHHRLAVVIPVQRVRQEFDHAIQAASRGVRVQGFRPGKAPVEVLRKMLGEGVDEQAREHLFEHIIPEAIHASGHSPLRLVDFDPTKIEVHEDQELRFEFELESAPSIDLPPWEELSVLSEPTDATEEQVQQAILGLGRENPKFDDSEADGLDEQTLAECDLQFLREGEEGPTAEALKLGLSAPLYGCEPEEFEQTMRGVKTGEERTLAVTFNDGFERKDWVGSAGTAKLLVKRLVTPRPASPEELAEAMGLEGGPEELLSEAAKQIGAQNEQAEKQRQVQAAFDAILEARPFDLPNRLVEEEAKAALESEIERMTESGVEREEAASQVKTMEEELRKDALSRLRHYFLVRRIAAAEKVRVTEGDMEMAYRQLGARHGADAKTVKAYYEEQGMANQLGGEILEGKVRAAVARIIEKRAAAPAEVVESGGAAE